VPAPYVFAVIPARGGSKGLPRKNLRRLGALSLIGHAAASAREAKTLSRVVLSTDDEEIAQDGRRHGLEVPFLRPAELANDQAGMVPVLQHAVRWLEESGPRPDLVVTLQPTSPFRTGDAIDRTVEKVIETGAGSAQTLVEASYHPFFMKTMPEGDRTVPLFPHGHTIVRRQDAPPVYQPSGAVYVTRYDLLMKDGHVLAEDNRGLVMGFEESVNIDTEWDFLLAELILRAGRAPLPPGRR